MKILIAHNQYRFPGGEEVAVDQHVKALTSLGHDVKVFTKSSKDWANQPRIKKILGVPEIFYSTQTEKEVSEISQKFQPDIIHTHNIFPFISPSIYTTAEKLKIPVIQTLHNFRFFCMNGLLNRDNKPCQKCLGGNPFFGLIHACYQDSRASSAIMAGVLKYHQIKKTFQKGPSKMIALSQFSREKFIAAGFPPEKITVLRNAVEVSHNPPKSISKNSRFIFIGRLSPEKGINTLMRAFEDSFQHDPKIKLDIIGNGPWQEEVRHWVKNHWENVIYHDALYGVDLEKILSTARALVFPSQCYENSPYAVIESLSRGIPVLGSDLGGIPELVIPGKTGWLFEPENPILLSKLIQDISNLSEDEMEKTQSSCIQFAQSELNLLKWAKKLEAIYDQFRPSHRLPPAQKNDKIQLT